MKGIMTDHPEYVTICNKDQKTFPQKFLQIKPEGLLKFGFREEEIKPHLDVDELTYLTLKRLYQDYVKPYHYWGDISKDERKNIL